jgi:hypothetical protein
MPASVETLVLNVLSQALHAAVDEINDQAEVMPDNVTLSTINAKINSVSGLFVDTSEGGQFSLMGTLTPDASGLGSLVLPPRFKGSINANNAFKGDGQFYQEDLSVTQVVKGVTVTVVGDGYIFCDLNRQ